MPFLNDYNKRKYNRGINSAISGQKSNHTFWLYSLLIIIFIPTYNKYLYKIMCIVYNNTLHILLHTKL